MFKSIKGYEGLYEVSEDGEVVSLRGGKRLTRKARISNSGYMMLNLTDSESRAKIHYIHELVAKAFLPDPTCNPDGTPFNPNQRIEVNHKDENKCNNSVSNLEWCDHRYNLMYGNRNQKIRKPVCCIDLQMEFISMDAVVDYMRKNGHPKATSANLSKHLQGNHGYSAYYGHVFKRGKLDERKS